MKKLFFVLGFSFFAATQVQAQSAGTVLDGLLKGRKTGNSSGTNTTSSGISLGSLSNSEVVNALKQALEVGAKNAGSKLSLKDGFFGNALVKILLPPEAQQAEKLMRQFGLGSLADKVVLQMNRAAEDAATKAAPIFVNAITSMSIQDGITILKGGNGAATNYLKSKTVTALTSAFRPVIQTSLNKLNVDTYWNQLFSSYNKLPIVTRKINPDLTAYVTERALNGLFVTVAAEENKIRTDPAARVTDLLKKVFGAK
ncbi:MAG TPA: DUF4197 domain-containing protein [Flavipsychrobacter sp.]|nr:DUF4197 domain-containing protein [Flavipsychrobacter sp.]